MTMKMARVLDVRDSNSAVTPSANGSERLIGELEAGKLLARFPNIQARERELLFEFARRTGVKPMRRMFVSRGLGPQLIALEREVGKSPGSGFGAAAILTAILLVTTLVQALAP